MYCWKGERAVQEEYDHNMKTAGLSPKQGVERRPGEPQDGAVGVGQGEAGPGILGQDGA